MKAVAVFPGPQEVKVVEQELPRLTQPDQVLLRILDTGICGTDKEICTFEYGTPPPGDDYLVIGHEAVAEVARAGRPSSASRRETWSSRRCAVPVPTPAAWPAGPVTRT